MTPTPITSRHLPKPQLILVLFIVFIALIALLIIGGLKASEVYRKQYLQRQAQQMKPPTDPVKREIRRLLLKKTLEDGTVQYVEILKNGLINIYDADMNFVKSDLSSYYKVQAIFDKINANLDKFQSDSQGTVILTVDTNMGQFSIIIDQTIQDEIHDIIDEILDEIDDVIDDVFAPTPTIQPTPTPIPGQPSPSPSPSAIPTPIPSGPTPTPNPNATPTPLPDYMTAPPFKCSEYEHLGRPINISNIICGVD